MKKNNLQNYFNMNRIVIGIDPGANGGIAIWDNETGLARVAKMPKDITDLRGLLEYYRDDVSGNPIVFLEKLSVRPDDVAVDGGKPNMGKLYRIQKMMGAFEQLKATIEIMDVPYIMVHPMTWQSKLDVRVKGEEKPARKKRYAKLAGQWYPNIKTTLWNADALLIMRFGVVALKTCPKWILSNLPVREHSKLV